MRSGSDITNNYKGPLTIALRRYPQLIIHVAVFVGVIINHAMF